MSDNLYADFCEEYFKQNILTERKIAIENIIDEWPL